MTDPYDDIGYRGIDQETSKGIKEHFSKERLKRTVEVLKSLPNPGERVHVDELKDILKRVELSGDPVDKRLYDKGARQIWAYLVNRDREIKQELRTLKSR